MYSWLKYSGLTYLLVFTILGNFHLETAQIFVNCDYRIDYRRWDNLLEILVQFPFYNHLQIYARPDDLAQILNLASFLGKFQLKTAQTYWQFLFCQIDVEISQATLIPSRKQCDMLAYMCLSASDIHFQ